MIISKASTYGIRSVAYLAGLNEGEVVSIRQLGQQLEIPAAFLTKIMQRLAVDHIVQTTRGHGGGVRLGRKASMITLYEIVIAIDGGPVNGHQWIGLPENELIQLPEFYEKWEKLNLHIDEFFKKTIMSEFCPADNFHDDKQLANNRRSGRSI